MRKDGKSGRKGCLDLYGACDFTVKNKNKGWTKGGFINEKNKG